MSGGTFDYKQYDLGYMADLIEQEIRTNSEKDCDGYCENFSSETLHLLKLGENKLREALIFAQRIDWLLAGDDGEETFKKRLTKDLEKHGYNNVQGK